MISYEMIKELCKRKGVSISKAEKDLGFSKGYLCKIGNISPSVDRLQRIADYFSVTLEYLMGVNKEKYYLDEDTSRLAQEIFDNPELRILLSASRNLKPEVLKSLVNIVESMGSDNDFIE